MRLIDADALILDFNDWWYSQFKEEQNDVSLTIQEAMNAIEEAPTIEAVPQKWIDEQLMNHIIEHADLVTCKDCINYNDQNGFCHYSLKPEDKDGYCSHGERIEE